MAHEKGVEGRVDEPPSDSPGIEAVAQISINAADLARAVSFYREALGLRLLFEIPNAAFFDCGGTRLMLAVPETPELDHAASILYYRVGSLDAAHQALLGRGATFQRDPHLVARMPDHELWMAFLEDSEGNLLALREERK